jgi:hypothetical protein
MNAGMPLKTLRSLRLRGDSPPPSPIAAVRYGGMEILLEGIYGDGLFSIPIAEVRIVLL